MFVDDEPDILKMAAIMLTQLGYEVTTFSSPLQALERFRADPGVCDIVITDQVMPGMSGDQLATAMMSLRPNLPVILCTGFSETISAPQARAMGIREFVLKPVVKRYMAEAIRRALGN
jgi:DNA-binding NtrC family response regulator